MDDLDQRLLAELQAGGFQRSSVLAPRLGVEERTVRRRISIMRHKGIIKVVAVPNLILTGHTAWAKVGIKVELGSLGDVARQLIENPLIYFVAHSLGAFDIMIALHLDSMDELTHFVGSELTKIEGISKAETMILMHPRKYYNFSWPAYPAEGVDHLGEHGNDRLRSRNGREIDEIDRRILGALMEDGLARPATLKSRLGIGESTIRKRIKKMFNTGVYRMEVVPNPEVLEYEAWATMGLTIQRRPAHEVIDAIIENPAVYLAAVSLGRFNAIISARFHNTDLLRRFVNEELPLIKGVNAVEVFLHSRPLKYHSIDWSDPSNSRRS